MSETIAVIGLGYVGLPLAIALAKRFNKVIGFDINSHRINELKDGFDRTNEVDSGELNSTIIKFSHDTADLRDATFYIVTVPTPIDRHNSPDLMPMIKASRMIGQFLNKNDVVVYESTVYPGVTEEVCGPILSETSGLKQYDDFKLGYSPERINPGDKLHTVESIVKIISAQDEETLDRLGSIYGTIVHAGLHRASSIKVAEAAKVIENTQRDLNIALMNELALIFDRIGIRTLDVLEAAGTKWNFLPFRPGLVGGHCIGVDPYYLTQKAQEVGYYPQVILAGRRVNDGMGAFIAQKVIKMLIAADISVKGARVGILGITFKENVPDLRNSRVPDIIEELKEFGLSPVVYDPYIEPHEAKHEYDISLGQWEDFSDLDALVLAVAHKEFVALSSEEIASTLKKNGVLLDIKSALPADTLPGRYWSL